MKTQQKNQRGFTLVEMMVSMTVMLVITVAIFSIIVAEQSTHLTQSRKLDMNQGARVIEQMLTEGFRNAGAVLTLAPKEAMLNSQIFPFNGIYPLNNDNSTPSPDNIPDGVILAAGDPMSLTRLTEDFNSGAGIIKVKSVDLPFDPTGLTQPGVAWHNNDYGLVMRPDGYYVFRVSATPNLNATQLNIRTIAAYYSGLLNTNGYKDNSLPLGNVGPYPGPNPITGYPGSPVVRLKFFNIFLVRIEADGSKTLTLTTDCQDQFDVLANTLSLDTCAVPIMPNIEDLQIEYITKLVPPIAPGQLPDIWAGPNTLLFPGNGANFYNQFLLRNIASARIFVLLRTEEEKNKQYGSGPSYDKPDMGDVPAPLIPLTGRYHYTFMEFEILIRNYNN